MGQFRPSSLIPSTLTSDYTIDATVDNVFRCKINGTSPTTKYRLTIMQNNTESTQVYDSGLQTLSTPLYPKNYDGTDNELEVTVPSTSGMINGGEYKWKIASYWTDDDYYESFDNVFMAYAATTVSIDTFPSPITQKQYTFSATVTQTQNVGVERFGWIIRNASTQEVLIDTISSNNIYSADVRVYYDGFLNDTNYEIRVCVWMMDGTTVETEFQPISVSYSVEPFESVVTARQTKDSGVLVKWSNIYYVFGTPTNDDYSYELTYPWSDEFTNVYLNLESGNSLTYNQITGQPISLPTTITHTICFRCEQNNASVYRANGTDSSGSDYYIEVSYDNGVVYLDINGTKSTLYTMTDVDKFLTLQIQQNQVVIKRMIGNLDGLYPSETLYPSDDLFPHDETYSYVDTTVSISGIIPDGIFNEFILSGPSLLRYFWIRTTPIPADIFAQMGSGSYLPEWDIDTRILATFQNTLSAGNAQSSSEVVGWLVYRLDEGTTNLQFIRMNAPERNYLVDYAAKNQVSVVYYVFPSFENEIGLPNMSESFTPNWWSWDLIVCDTYGDDQYYVAETHKFDLNVTSNQMTNNTSYSMLTNFTPYAKVQASYSNYWTGTLTALLGNCGITYQDTVEQMNQIKALANDNRDKFLKDRKGNIWKVRLSAPVGEQVTDAYVEQAVTVTLIWSEVGSAENSSVTEPLTVQVEDIIVEG